MLPPKKTAKPHGYARNGTGRVSPTTKLHVIQRRTPPRKLFERFARGKTHHVTYGDTSRRLCRRIMLPKGAHHVAEGNTFPEGSASRCRRQQTRGTPSCAFPSFDSVEIHPSCGADSAYRNSVLEMYLALSVLGVNSRATHLLTAFRRERRKFLKKV